jgi:hypothetical protein
MVAVERFNHHREEHRMSVTSVTHRRRALVTLAALVGALLPAATATSAAHAASPLSSCVGVITSWEASQLPAGSVGGEVSGLAHSVPSLGSVQVAPLAREHRGSLEDCAQAG